MGNCIRVLQVVTIMNQGGLENMIMSLYRNIDRSMVQFDFVVHKEMPGHFDEEIKSLGGKIYYAPLYTIFNYSQYKVWWHVFFKEHPEYKIVHSHAAAFASRIHLKIANKYNRTTILHSHSTRTGYGIKGRIKDIFRINVNKIPKYLFACSDMAGEWLYGNDRTKQDNYFVLKNAINTNDYLYNEYTRNQIRNDLNIGDRFVVGHVGNFNYAKNHLFLLRIFSDLLKHIPAVLILVGDGALREEITEEATKLGIINQVIMTGVRSDVNDLLQAMDCFVFPSIYEGLPVTVIESQAAGLPCIISDTITSEVCITGLVKQVSISESESVWAKEIINTKSICRKDMYTEIYESGYDIHSTAKWLSDFYLEKAEEQL